MPTYDARDLPDIPNIEIISDIAIFNAVLPLKRKLIARELALKYNVTTRTIYRWAKHKKFSRSQTGDKYYRSDRGRFHIPPENAKHIYEYFWNNPASSARSAHRHLVANHREEMTYASKSGISKVISVGTVNRIHRIFRKGWLAEVKSSGSRF